MSGIECAIWTTGIMALVVLAIIAGELRDAKIRAKRRENWQDAEFDRDYHLSYEHINGFQTCPRCNRGSFNDVSPHLCSECELRSTGEDREIT